MKASKMSRPSSLRDFFHYGHGVRLGYVAIAREAFSESPDLHEKGRRKEECEWLK